MLEQPEQLHAEQAIREVREKGTLDGGPVLPGFRLPVAELFRRAGARPEEG